MKPLPSKFLIIFLKKRMKKRKLISTQLPIETPILTFYENHQYLAPPQFSFPHPLLATYAPYICGNQAGLFQIHRRPFHLPPLLILYHPTKLLTLAVLTDNNSTSSGPIWIISFFVNCSPSPNHACSLSSPLLMWTEIPSGTFSHSYSSYSCTQASKDLDFAHCCKTSILNSESKSLTSPAN